jgi:uncharacterized protein YxeA
MKKYIIGVIVLGLIVVGAVLFIQSNNTNKVVALKKLSYQYSTDIWTKVPLQDDGPARGYNSKLELYSAGESYENTKLLATVNFPDKLIKKEDAVWLVPRLGTKECSNANSGEKILCSASAVRGIAITLHPEAYEALAVKFKDEICRFSEEKYCSGTFNVGGRTGKVFTQSLELAGWSYYLLPMDKNSTLVAKVDYDGNDKEYADFTTAQLNAILASAKLE